MLDLRMGDEWQRITLRHAYRRSLDSPDPSTQNAAYVFDSNMNTIGRGINTFTTGMKVRDEMLERPLKYSYIEHAERNALYSVLRGGGGYPHVMVCPWAACSDCARAIVQSGIKYLIRHAHKSSDWDDSIAIGDEMMRAGGVTIITVEGDLGGCKPVKRNGETFIP